MRKSLLVVPFFSVLLAAPLSAKPSSRAATTPKLFSTPAPREYSRLKLEARRKGGYKAEIIVPVLRSQTSVARMANRTVRDWSQQQIKSFVRDATKYTREKQEGMPEAYLDARPSDVFVTPRLVSLSMAHSDYMGGAHGMHSHITWRFGRVGSVVRAVNLGDFFSGNTYQKQVNDAVMRKLRAEPRADWVKPSAEGSMMVKALTTSQLNDFSVARNGLTWTFAPYDMGSYASGTIVVQLSPDELGPNFRREWLR
ncbi:MAG TPA: DUF3298 domain-containing protein [Abditibacteriaceae bacterium]|jgi:hypothetical protein